MKKKLLVTGACGFVAGSVIAQAMLDHDVYGVGQSKLTEDVDSLKYYPIDLRESKRFSEFFDQIRPDAVIHTAAISDIDFCQKNQELAKEVNVGVTRDLIRLCKEFKTRLIFCSTDTVFDGKKGLYVEQDQPNPVNYYAETKVKCEDLIKQNLPNAVIARLALVMGLPVLGKGNSFLAKTIEKLSIGESVQFPSNEIRTPIDVITLGRALVELAGNDFVGIIHLAGNDHLTRFEIALRIAKRLGYSLDLILPTNSSIMKGRVPRPSDVSLDNSKARHELDTPMMNLLEGLELSLTFPKESA